MYLATYLVSSWERAESSLRSTLTNSLRYFEYSSLTFEFFPQELDRAEFLRIEAAHKEVFACCFCFLLSSARFLCFLLSSARLLFALLRALSFLVLTAVVLRRSSERRLSGTYWIVCFLSLAEHTLHCLTRLSTVLRLRENKLYKAP